MNPADRPAGPDIPAPRTIATLQVVQGPQGRILQLVTTCADYADHAWLDRDRLLQLCEGATAFQVIWQGPAGPVEVSYAPQLPEAHQQAAARPVVA